MAITLPVYTNCLRQNVGDPGGTSEYPGTALKIRHSGEAAIGGAHDAAVEAASPGIARGLLVGVRATCSASAGNVTIRVYSDVSKTDELYNVDLAMTASPFKSSNMLAQGVPFFSPPYFTIQCSVDPNATVFVTFYVKSIAGN